MKSKIKSIINRLFNNKNSVINEQKKEKKIKRNKFGFPQITDK